MKIQWDHGCCSSDSVGATENPVSSIDAIFEEYKMVESALDENHLQPLFSQLGAHINKFRPELV
jgi:hypothetical protein